MKYVSGTEVVDLKDVFSYYYNIFDSTGTKQLENIDWGFFFELMEDLSDVTLSPGQSSKCSKAILVSKGNTPVLYRSAPDVLLTLGLLQKNNRIARTVNHLSAPFIFKHSPSKRTSS